jgi:hypothetical protein
METPEGTHGPRARMPVLSVGHGSPMNAVEDNVWSRGFRDLGARLPRAEAILSISAHWFVRGTFLTGDDRPKTIHGFGGFPKELYDMQYPAPGAPALARRVVRLSIDGRLLDPRLGRALRRGGCQGARGARRGVPVESPGGRGRADGPPHARSLLPPALRLRRSGSGSAVSFPLTGFDMGSLSMRAVLLG